MQTTRKAILDHLHQQGRATVKELAASLKITRTGVRQHLSVLERDGMVQSRGDRGHVGRPALVYALSDTGEALYPKQYDRLANMLMEEVRAAAGAEALQRVLRRISARMADQHRERVEGRPLDQRVRETVAIMQEMGCVAACERKGDEFYLYQCTCPYPNVARRNSGVCALEVDYVRRLTGADAHLVTSLLRGDRACTYRIRPAAPTTPSPPGVPTASPANEPGMVALRLRPKPPAPPASLPHGRL